MSARVLAATLITLAVIGVNASAADRAGASSASAPATPATSMLTTSRIKNLAVLRPSTLEIYADTYTSPGSLGGTVGDGPVRGAVPLVVLHEDDSTVGGPPSPSYYYTVDAYQRSTALYTSVDDELGENYSTRYGRPGDLPVRFYCAAGVGPFAALFRPSNGTWYGTGYGAIPFGRSGDIPVPGDYAGTGARDQLAVFRPSTGTWYIHATTALSATQTTPAVPGTPFRAIPYGRSGDVPVPAAYLGGTRKQVAVFRPSDGTWYIQGVGVIPFGHAGDIPVPGDYRLDGGTEIAVYRPSNSTWYVRGLGSVRYGRPGDVPLPGLRNRIPQNPACSPAPQH